jgi:hypothetical protein
MDTARLSGVVRSAARSARPTSTRRPPGRPNVSKLAYPEAVTDPARRRGTPRHAPPIPGQHALGATAASYLAVASKRVSNVVRKVHSFNLLRG